MSDNYQAVYDAVRSRMSNCDVGRAIESIARDAFDISFAMQSITHEFTAAAQMMQSPSVLHKPELSRDGDHWCALLGDNLQVGLAGFGKTAAEAFAAFDEAFYKEQAK